MKIQMCFAVLAAQFDYVLSFVACYLVAHAHVIVFDVVNLVVQ